MELIFEASPVFSPSIFEMWGEAARIRFVPEACPKVKNTRRKKEEKKGRFDVEFSSLEKRALPSFSLQEKIEVGNFKEGDLNFP